MLCVITQAVLRLKLLEICFNNCLFGTYSQTVAMQLNRQQYRVIEWILWIFVGKIESRHMQVLWYMTALLECLSKLIVMHHAAKQLLSPLRIPFLTLSSGTLYATQLAGCPWCSKHSVVVQTQARFIDGIGFSLSTAHLEAYHLSEEGWKILSAFYFPA